MCIRDSGSTASGTEPQPIDSAPDTQSGDNKTGTSAGPTDAPSHVKDAKGLVDSVQSLFKDLGRGNHGAPQQQGNNPAPQSDTGIRIRVMLRRSIPLRLTIRHRVIHRHLISLRPMIRLRVILRHLIPLRPMIRHWIIRHHLIPLHPTIRRRIAIPGLLSRT